MNQLLTVAQLADLLGMAQQIGVFKFCNPAGK